MMRSLGLLGVFLLACWAVPARACDISRLRALADNSSAVYWGKVARVQPLNVSGGLVASQNGLFWVRATVSLAGRLPLAPLSQGYDYLQTDDGQQSGAIPERGQGYLVFAQASSLEFEPSAKSCALALKEALGRNAPQPDRDAPKH